MRTTLTLDEDVAAVLKRLRKARDCGLKELVNSVLREGLKRMTTPAGPRRPFHTQSVSLGRCYVPNLDDVSEVLATAEGERFK
jgi:hypothetical protein